MARILVVDDEAEIRKFLSRIMKHMGHDVLEAPDGQVALTIFQDEEIDLSFVDINMPGMNGITFLEEVKVLDPSAIVIIMTGYPSADTIMKTIEDDGYTYITKPFHVEQIKDLVLRGLGAKGL
ncbi:response regulator [bacterium]|nr:response regulator [bacterium]